MKTPTSLRWHSLDTPTAVAQMASTLILTAARQAIAQRGRFCLALAGGRTPLLTYSLLQQAHPDWAFWHIFYADERCAPPGHPDRNDAAVQRTLWGTLIPPSAHHYSIPAYSTDPYTMHKVAIEYANLIEPYLPFDLVLLGIGEDGHIASLFPGQTHSPGQLVHPVFHAPKPPPDRISLSMEALNNTREMLILVTGQEKRNALAAWQRGEPLPVAQLSPSNGIDVIIENGLMKNG